MGSKKRTTASGYAGEYTSAVAWRVLQETADAVLVDVRTRAEWSFVGVPDLSSLGKQTVLIEWQTFPPAERPRPFVDDLKRECSERGIAHDAPVLFLCRSGARSRAAAMAATEAGFSKCFNVSDGFEGDLNAEHRRGTVNGWKQSGLPWVQS